MQAPECAWLAKNAKAAGLHVMVFSGYTWEELAENAANRTGWPELLAYTDILIDGRYEQKEHSLNLRFRGSRNQRAIDVPASQAQNQVVLYPL